MKYIILFLFLILFKSIVAQPLDSVLLKQLLQANPDLFSVVLNDSSHKQVQILYTQINRDKHNVPHFKTFSYRLNDQHYFYPASTVKLPEAIFALEKLHALNIKGLDRNTTMITDSVRKEQIPVTVDKSAQNGLPSINN